MYLTIQLRYFASYGFNLKCFSMVSEKKRSRLRHRNGPKTKSKSKFDEFLEMEMGRGDPTAEEDLELERRLAKKLKVKKGKLTGPDDGINTLFQGLFSDIDLDNEINYQSDEDEDLPVRAESPVPDKKKKKKQKRKHSKLQSEEGNTGDEGSTEAEKKRKKKRKQGQVQSEEGNIADEAKISETGKKKKEKRKKKVVERETTEGEETGQRNEKSEDKPVERSSVSAKYVAPHLRAIANAESEEIAQTRRRVRGMYLDFFFLFTHFFSYHIMSLLDELGFVPGLLNRMSESNVESITEEIAAIFRVLYLYLQLSSFFLSRSHGLLYMPLYSAGPD